MSALSFILIAGCSNLQSSPVVSSSTLVKNDNSTLVSIAPDIPFPADKAFFPMEKDLSGVYYQWKVCEKKFIFCVKWKIKKVSFKFNDRETMMFFKANDFGLTKRKNP